MKKSASLQALRALAFTDIFYFHYGLGFCSGAFGVSLFVILSGFCMQLSYYRRPMENVTLISSARFAINKVSKLYIMHLLILLLCLTVYKIEFSKLYIYHFFLVQSLIPDVSISISINGVAWYLSTFLYMSLAAPWLLKKLNGITSVKRIARLMLIIYAAMTFIGWLVSQKIVPLADDRLAHYLTYICPIYRLGDLSLGICLARLVQSTDMGKRGGQIKYTLFELLTVIVALAANILYHRGQVPAGLRFTAMFVPISIASVYLFYVKKGLVTKLCTNCVLVIIGDLSSYAFLIHVMVMSYVRHLFIDYSIPDWEILRLVGCYAATLLVAAIYRAAESIIIKGWKRVCISS